MDATELWPSPDRRERWLKLIELLDPRPGDRVLDVGCGSGQALRFIAQRTGPAGRGIGVEYGPHATDRLSGLRDGGQSTRLDPVIADAQELPFADETFDAVLCVNVLEAVPDRVGALLEMRRVLRPGGRVVVAHDDYESQVYTGTDRELCRRAVRAYADATFASYTTSDGQMGRHVWGIFKAAGFRAQELRVLPLVNTEYREPLLGWIHAQFSAGFVAGVSDLTQADLDRWHADLEERSVEGAYLYCVNLFVCLGQK